MDELDNRHSGFWRSLVRWLWTVKTPLKMLATDAKNAKNRTRSELFYNGQKFRRQCVNVIDIAWGRIYFSTCENFRRKFRTQCAMALSVLRNSHEIILLSVHLSSHLFNWFYVICKYALRVKYPTSTHWKRVNFFFTREIPFQFLNLNWSDRQNAEFKKNLKVEFKLNSKKFK